jgi:2-polyprenyl-3-methyl-5-hydroxy-6-metoxy-1,4-benzoquinol methylase
MQRVDRSERFWDSRSDEYDRNEAKYKQTYHKIVENTKTHLDTNEIVLDYACGTGVITNEIAGHVKEIHGVDISSKMIDVATRRAGERKLDNVHYAQSTIFDERYEKESFDVVLAFSILHLLEDTHKIVQRLSELLKPGGLFISATPCLGEKKSFLSILFFLMSKTGITPYMRFLRFSDLEGLVANGNFEIVETENLHQTPPNYFIVAKKIQRP